MQSAVDAIRHCDRCHTFTEASVCATCLDDSRDKRLLCVVETPADQAAMERTGTYRGLYFVLMGHLSPLDGVGVRDIGLQQLLERASDGVVQEVICATNFTAEGEAGDYTVKIFMLDEAERGSIFLGPVLESQIAVVSGT